MCSVQTLAQSFLLRLSQAVVKVRFSSSIVWETISGKKIAWGESDKNLDRNCYWTFLQINELDQKLKCLAYLVGFDRRCHKYTRACGSRTNNKLQICAATLNRTILDRTSSEKAQATAALL